jgi:AraC-like DNA-binding protein/CheY-like chemotaxis protein
LRILTVDDVSYNSRVEQAGEGVILPMVKNPIIVVTDRANRLFYEALIIDDERIVIHDLADVYESFGICGCTVLLLDTGHTPEKGLQLLARVKTCCMSVPIIFLTDVSSEELVISAFKAGVREYFKKPVSMPELQNSIVTLLRLRRSTVDTRIPHTVHQGLIEQGETLTLNSELPDGLLRTVRYLNEHLTENIHLDKVAEEAGMSKYHFCRIFKKSLGMSPMQFLTISRIELAKVLLRKSGASITSVIYKVGFNDISGFNRQFKKLTGMTPTDFKESLKIIGQNHWGHNRNGL